MHEELQFTVVLSDELIIQVYNESYMLKTGEGIFINSGMLHVTKFLSEDGAYVSFNCSMKMLGFFPVSLMETACVLPYIRDKALPAIVFKSLDDWEKKVPKVRYREVHTKLDMGSVCHVSTNQFHDHVGISNTFVDF